MTEKVYGKGLREAWEASSVVGQEKGRLAHRRQWSHLMTSKTVQYASIFVVVPMCFVCHLCAYFGMSFCFSFAYLCHSIGMNSSPLN